MAVKSLNTAVSWLHDRNLECIICEERYNEPKALDCMHSFCQGCLVDYYKDAQVKNCPVCSEPTTLPEAGVRGLKGNFYINSLLADLAALKVVDSSSDKPSSDKPSSDKPSSDKPSSDKPSSDKPSSDKPSSDKPSSDKPSSDKPSSDKPSSDKHSEDGPKCEKHRKCIELFCVPCKKLICRECSVIDHQETKGHRILDCKNAALELRKTLQDVFPDRKRDIEACKQSLKESSKARQHLHENVASAVSAVHAKVKREEERLIKDIETQERDRITKFDQHEETVTKMLQEKQFTLEVIEDVVKNCSDSTFLDMYSDMTSQTSSQAVPKIDLCLSRTFEKSKTIDVDLGTLEKESKLQLFKKGGKWKRCNQFCSFRVVTGIAALAHSDELALIPHTQNKAIVINDTTGKLINVFNVHAGAFSIAEIQDKLVVVDTESNRVKVHKRDGTPAFDFDTVPDFLRDSDIKVNLRSVAVRKTGTIVVGDLRNASISEHFHDGSILGHIFIKNHIQPYYLAIDSNDRIVVGDRGPQVVVIDDNGDSLLTIKPTIGDNKVNCLSIFCDGSGIYITVSIVISGDRSAHIHQYDIEGRFINCIAKDLESPLAVTFTSDGQRLAVADTNSVKMYHKV